MVPDNQSDSSICQLRDLSIFNPNDLYGPMKDINMTTISSPVNLPYKVNVCLPISEDPLNLSKRSSRLEEYHCIKVRPAFTTGLAKSMEFNQFESLGSEDKQNQEISINYTDKVPSLAQKKWKRLSLVIKGVNAFREMETKKVDIRSIEKEIQDSPLQNKNKIKIMRSSQRSTTTRKVSAEKKKTSQQRYKGHMMKIIEDHRRVEYFSTLCSNGSAKDLEILKLLIDTDPRRNLRSISDPSHITNKLNSQGEPPLFVACKNQCIEVVKFLLLSGSLLSQKTKLGETCLQVAVRWRYVEIVKLLLQYERAFPTDEIIKCKKLAKNHQEIFNLLQGVLNQRHTSCWQSFLNCLKSL